MERSRVTYLLLLIIVFFTPARASAQDIFDYDHSIPYLAYLASQKKFALAEEELARLRQAYPERSDTLGYLHLRLLAAKDDHSALIREVGKLVRGDRVLPRYLAVYAMDECLEADSINLLEAVLRHSTLDAGTVHVVKLHTAFYRRDTAEAAREIAALKSDSALCYPYTFFYDAARGVRHRSASMAALLSAVVPGTGKMYASQWQDGWIAFVMTGMFAFQSWHGFYQKGIESVYGWIFAGFTGAFYSGNIYGSAQAAKRFNAKQLNEYHERIRQSFHCAVR